MAVAYNINYQDRTGRGKHMVNADIVYTSESYSAGLPVSGASIGLPNVIESLLVIDQGGGFAARYNGGKIRLYQEGAGAGALTELAAGSQTLTLKVIAIGW